MEKELERAAKALPLVLGAIYVVGFLVVGIYLAYFGASSLELFKVQYLAAGFWCLLPFVVFFWLSAFFRTVIRRWLAASLEVLGIHPRQPRTFPLTRVVWGAIGETVAADGFLILAVVVVWWKNSQAHNFYEPVKRASNIREISPGVVALLLGVIAVIDLRFVVRRALREFPVSLDDLRGKVFLVAVPGTLEVLGVFLLIILVLAFSVAIYPRISFSLGGGEPLKVVFVLNEGAGQTTPSSRQTMDREQSHSIARQWLR